MVNVLIIALLQVFKFEHVQIRDFVATKVGGRDSLSIYGKLGTRTTEEKISLKVPSRMKIDETIAIEIIYHRYDNYEYTDKFKEQMESLYGTSKKNENVLQEHVSIELYAPAFEIAPSKKITKYAGTPSPTKFVWLVTPKKEGDQRLLINTGETLKLTLFDQLTSELFINGERVDEQSAYTLEDAAKIKSEPLQIPLTVDTIWGVSRRFAGIIQALLGFIVFILMYPLFTDFIKNKHIVR